MFAQNTLYNRVLDLEYGFQFMMKTEIVKMSKVALKNSTEDKITHINIDVNVPSVLTTLCKPFIERCSKIKTINLHEMKLFWLFVISILHFHFFYLIINQVS